LSRDQGLGVLLVIAGILGILIYGWLVFFTSWWAIVLQITAFVAIAAVLAIIAWIGYTLATTPPPKPIEEIEKELEKEQAESEAKGETEQKEEAPASKPEK
jgi:predicted DNA-binding transcriptional regulator